MPSQGPNGYSANADGGGGSYSSPPCTLSGSSVTLDYVYFTGFSFGIPAGSLIDGIAASVAFSLVGSPPTANDVHVRLLLSNALYGSDHSTGAAWGGVNSYGGPTDNWSADLTYADVNDSSFGIAVQGQASGSGAINITSCQMTVYYTLGGAIVIDGYFTSTTPDAAARQIAACGDRPLMLPYRCQRRNSRRRRRRCLVAGGR